MLSSQTQQKIIGAMLKRPQNVYCSDCNGKSPCWASLDFGVFVCMNCSGAHRALGPSITRVKSTKLDTWNKDWVQNMKVGNSILNEYWQNQLSSQPMNTKPNVNSSLNQIKKYVYDKYVKRKFVDPHQKLDPLTKVKQGIALSKPQKQQPKQQQKPQNAKPIVTPKVNNNVSTIEPIPKTQPIKTQQTNAKKSNQVQLLNFHEPFTNGHNQKSNEITNNPVFCVPSNFNVNGHSHGNQHQNGHNNDPSNNLNAVNHPVDHNKNVTFQNFLDNLSNKSVSSHNAHGHGHNHKHPQTIHGNYFMSPQGFVNSTHHDPHHAFSLPSGNMNVPFQGQNQNMGNLGHHQMNPQVTMNINMNMYPNVMNINMGSSNNTMPNYITNTVTPPIQNNPHLYVNPNLNMNPANGNYGMNNNLQGQQVGMHHSATSNQLNNSKQFEYNDFFTGNIKPPKQNTNSITLEVTIKQKEEKQKKSWIEDWM